MENKIKEYLSFFLKQSESGLLIFEKEKDLALAEKIITKNGLNQVKDGLDLMEMLADEKSVYLILGDAIDKENYDAISQYFSRKSAIQLMDKQSMTLKNVEFNPLVSRLLLLITEKDLNVLEKTHSIRNIVGLIQRIN
ncbi:MAG TPA: hypothetical protein PK980_08380 [Paludibacteraceae bacterium]|jgi:hypothetical protein|nr:hypothetical protein [Paludibacteraceae bacterium]